MYVYKLSGYDVKYAYFSIFPKNFHLCNMYNISGPPSMTYIEEKVGQSRLDA